MKDKIKVIIDKSWEFIKEEDFFIFTSVMNMNNRYNKFGMTILYILATLATAIIVVIDLCLLVFAIVGEITHILSIHTRKFFVFIFERLFKI